MQQSKKGRHSKKHSQKTIELGIWTSLEGQSYLEKYFCTYVDSSGANGMQTPQSILEDQGDGRISPIATNIDWAVFKKKCNSKWSSSDRNNMKWEDWRSDPSVPVQLTVKGLLSHSYSQILQLQSLNSLSSDSGNQWPVDMYWQAIEQQTRGQAPIDLVAILAMKKGIPFWNAKVLIDRCGFVDTSTGQYSLQICGLLTTKRKAVAMNRSELSPDWIQHTGPSFQDAPHLKDRSGPSLPASFLNPDAPEFVPNF
ncbi:hypothetical protein RFI_26432 [Reticulomyxa filosa]|uniref:Uncharacterized protein n=1 Tax=Reticulomyxa filosa TaxID=46433 RepID=X6MAS3_RETFI|nr:hypothetical protein RFI_26432 [Reticulomyxa filosa]|eukprot:ETO10944.1 hypothetical protein RFI_26432 [Reticulomyxa filosa]